MRASSVEIHIESPIGTYVLGASDAGLCRVALAEVSAAESAPSAGAPARTRAHTHAAAGARALRAYFAGESDAFDALALDPHGSDFERSVWAALREIPYGSTESYGALARRIGRPGAARAVGQANHRNPLGIVVPCHRVIGADGSLTGYASGTNRKRWLLEHESRPEGTARSEP